MDNQSTVSTLCLRLLAVIFLAVAVQAQKTAEDHFTQGKKLVEDNCIDCMGGNRDGEEAGIRELEMAIQSDEKPVEAYKLMAEAYANLTTYAKSESESQTFRNKEYDIYRKLYRLAPDDPQVLMEYAQTLTDIQGQIPIYQKVVGLDPKNADARFMLGDSLLGQGKIKEGIEEMRLAVTLESNPEAVRNIVERLTEALEKHNCPLQDASIYNREVVRAEAAATQGAGNPQPMLVFKKKFAVALERHSCTPVSANPETR